MKRNHRYGLNGRRCSCHPRHSYAPAGIFAILALLASFAPTTVLAAEASVNTQHNAIVVFTVISLLLGSVVAAIFFASPLRERWTAGEPELKAEPRRAVEPTSNAPALPHYPPQASTQPMAPTYPPQPQQPTPQSRPGSWSSSSLESGPKWGQPPRR